MIGEGSRRPCPCDCGTLGFCADRKALTRSRCCEPGCDEPKLEGGGLLSRARRALAKRGGGRCLSHVRRSRTS